MSPIPSLVVAVMPILSAGRESALAIRARILSMWGAMTGFSAIMHTERLAAERPLSCMILSTPFKSFMLSAPSYLGSSTG